MPASLSPRAVVDATHPPIADLIGALLAGVLPWQRADRPDLSGEPGVRFAADVPAPTRTTVERRLSLLGLPSRVDPTLPGGTVRVVVAAPVELQPAPPSSPGRSSSSPPSRRWRPSPRSPRARPSSPRPSPRAPPSRRSRRSRAPSRGARDLRAALAQEPVGHVRRALEYALVKRVERQGQPPGLVEPRPDSNPQTKRFQE